jgi:hypothetical protein
VPELVLNLDKIDRNTATHQLDGSTARILQRVDTNLFPGRMIRANGCSATQVTPSSTTVTSAYVFRRGDCKRALLDGSTAGTIRITPGELPKCCGPLPEWSDYTYSGYGPTTIEGGYFGLGLTSDPAAFDCRFVVTTTATSLRVYPDGTFFGTLEEPWVGLFGSFRSAAGSATDLLGYLFAPSQTKAYGWLSSSGGAWHFDMSGTGSINIAVTNTAGETRLINGNSTANGATIQISSSSSITVTSV